MSRDAGGEMLTALFGLLDRLVHVPREDSWAKATDDPDTSPNPDPEPTSEDMRHASRLLAAASAAIADYRQFLLERGLWEDFLKWRLRKAAGR